MDQDKEKLQLLKEIKQFEERGFSTTNSVDMTHSIEDIIFEHENLKYKFELHQLKQKEKQLQKEEKKGNEKQEELNFKKQMQQQTLIEGGKLILQGLSMFLSAYQNSTKSNSKNDSK